MIVSVMVSTDQTLAGLIMMIVLFALVAAAFNHRM